MCEISCVLEWGDLVDSEDLKDFLLVASCVKRLVSCDVERTFSQYKSLFRDNQHRFTKFGMDILPLEATPNS
jgi:hypothetical protein